MSSWPFFILRKVLNYVLQNISKLNSDGATNNACKGVLDFFFFLT